MDVLIAYATNSGGTYFASQTIKKALEAKKLSVTTAEVEDLSPHDFKKYDLIILGSCSWNYKDLEGQLPKSFEEFVKKTPANSLKGKKCAVFGLGDSSYLYFCGAVTLLERYVATNGGKLVAESIRIDGYYKHEKENNEKLRNWTDSFVL